MWDERGIPEIMKEIKSVSAHRINEETWHVGRVWQEESFDRALRREGDLDAKIRYMADNPVRARLVSTPAEYRWIWIKGAESRGTGDGRGARLSIALGCIIKNCAHEEEHTRSPGR